MAKSVRIVRGDIPGVMDFNRDAVRLFGCETHSEMTGRLVFIHDSRQVEGAVEKLIEKIEACLNPERWRMGDGVDELAPLVAAARAELALRGEETVVVFSAWTDCDLPDGSMFKFDPGSYSIRRLPDAPKKVRPYLLHRQKGSRLKKDETWRICDCGCIVSYDNSHPDTCPNCLADLVWSDLPKEGER
jgi:hypothetical protein